MPERFGIVEVHVQGFRSAREVSFAPRPICALVGEADAGKSNLLAAMRAALDPASAPLAPGDAVEGDDGATSIRVRLADGSEATLRGTAADQASERSPTCSPVLFLPAVARSSTVVAAADAHSPEAARALRLFQDALARAAASSAAPARAAVEALEEVVAARLDGLVLLVEEPELYLRPQAQRYLYRLFHEFAQLGNQVVYSTHSPAFLNIARLEEIVFVERLPQVGTRTAQPAPLTPDEDFRVLTEFDAERSEVFLAHAAVLVEGQTEKLVLPFVFAALGYDPDREAISIVECGGKPNIPLFARICGAVGVPYVVVHDSDARDGRPPIAAEQAVNALIGEVVGEERRVVLDPDFEAVAGLQGHSHKPERAWRRFAELGRDEIPAPLARAAELAVSLARGGGGASPPARPRRDRT
jgi:predicted ATPase